MVVKSDVDAIFSQDQLKVSLLKAETTQKFLIAYKHWAVASLVIGEAGKKKKNE